jgi:kynurenine formamidase
MPEAMTASSPRWKRRPEGSTWGDWGPDDQLGRMNLLTREKVLQGIAEVREGRTFCLSLPLDYPGGSAVNPRRTPPVLRPVQRQNGRPNMTYPLRCDDPTATDLVCDDQVLLTLQYSTQWDSLAHIGQMFDADGDGKPEDVFYNGWRAGADIAGPLVWHGTEASAYEGPQGARKLGVENLAVACLQGRAVMVDLEAHFGLSGKIVGYDDLRRVLETDSIVIEPGDFVCFRTGFAEMLLDMNRKPDAARLFSTAATLDGRDDRLLQWITDSGVVALIADNYAVEALPAKPCADVACASLPLHAHCLFRLGVNLGEMWYLTELADWLRAHGRSRFLLTAPPLRLPGAVGSPATPVATV